MPWAMLDDGFYDHPKVRAMRPALRNAAAGLYARSLSLCARSLSDGRLTQEDAFSLDGTDEQIAELVRVGLWEPIDGGYAVHDWLDYNDSAATVKERRRAAADRKRDQRARAAASRDGADVPPGQAGASHRDNGDVANARDASRDPSHPIPSPPVPSSRSEDPGDHARDDGTSTKATAQRPRREDDGWSSFTNPAWQPFKQAWTARGLRLPPSGDADDPKSQRGRLWPIAEAGPDRLARWVREAEGRTAYEVVGHVFRQWSALANAMGEPGHDERPEPPRDPGASRSLQRLGELISGR